MPKKAQEGIVAPLNREKRDELLIRLDERSQNTWRSVEEIKGHLATLNDSVAKHSVTLGINRKWLGFLSAIITTCIIALIKSGIL